MFLFNEFLPKSPTLGTIVAADQVANKSPDRGGVATLLDIVFRQAQLSAKGFNLEGVQGLITTRYSVINYKVQYFIQ